MSAGEGSGLDSWTLDRPKRGAAAQDASCSMYGRPGLRGAKHLEVSTLHLFREESMTFGHARRPLQQLHNPSLRLNVPVVENTRPAKTHAKDAELETPGNHLPSSAILTVNIQLVWQAVNY